MPQNAIIRADGTGDYTSLQAWEAAEQSANYGTITVGRVDGFFDVGSSQFIIGGSWTNGARLECFNISSGFNGVERQLCGMTGSSTFATLRTTIAVWQVEGLEVYNTSTGGAHRQTSVTPTAISVNNTIFKSLNGASALDAPAGASNVTNSVLASQRTYNNAISGSNVTLFGNSTSAIGGSGASTLSDTVSVNLSTGACFRNSVTQNNNASSDGAADALINIVIADNFVDPNPTVNGDYRILSGSDLATNGIGAFIQSGGNVTSNINLTVNKPVFSVQVSKALPSFNSNLSFELAKPVFSASASNTIPDVTSDISVTIAQPVFSVSAQNTIPGNASTISFDITKPIFSATASNTIPNTQADVSFDVTAPIFSVTAQPTQPGNLASVDLLITKPVFSVLASNDIPDITTDVNFTLGAPIFSVSMSKDSDQFYYDKGSVISLSEQETTVTLKQLDRIVRL